MAQTKILVDTNSYFRLAQNLHPLMRTPFGKDQYTLYAHKDLNWELKRVTRLKSKLQWVSESRYVTNRTRSPNLSEEQKEEIETTFEYMWEHAKEAFHALNGKGPGDTDTNILATALVLDIHAVTDDQDMIALANEFEVKHLSSMGLMKLMLDEQHIDMDKVRQVTQQWQYDNDTPNRNWKKEYKKLFGESVTDY